MSTPQTLPQQTAPHHYSQVLDYRGRPLLNVNDRQLPPPRPSSGLSNSYYTNLPPRSSSNLSNTQYPMQSIRSESSAASNQAYSASQVPAATSQQQHRQAREGASSASYLAHGTALTSKTPQEDNRRASVTGQPRPSSFTTTTKLTQQGHTVTGASERQGTPRNSSQRRIDHQLQQLSQNKATDATPRKRRAKNEPVDWVTFFNGKVPGEIITIHDDDSPAPQIEVQKPQQQQQQQSTASRSTHNSSNTAITAPVTTTAAPAPSSSSTSNHYHVDKRRRINNDATTSGATHYSTDTPRTNSYSNTNSTDSINNTTAATSLASVTTNASGSDASRIVDGTQIGQKRKRTSRLPEQYQQHQPYEDPRKIIDLSKVRPRGYLSDYGNYIAPLKQHKKQREVHVPQIIERGHRSNEKVDDDDGHYIVHEDSVLGDRYTLVSLLGQGTFGKVVRAIDRKGHREVAIKIIRAVPKYRDASRIELRVLQTLRAADEQNRNRCIQLTDCFDWRGHICIVTPLLGLSVFDFLKSGGFVPFPGSHIQAFAWQLLSSIAFLHDLNLIHTDLKPENILLTSHAYQTFTYNRNIPSSSTITNRTAKFRRVLLTPHINLIDFGSATFNDEYHSSVVSTRHYRAPEIILGIGWSHPIDLWSLGCILVECWTGDALFQTHDCAEHLAMMEAVTGLAIDKKLIKEVGKTSRRSDKNSAARFFKNGRLAYPLTDTPRQSRKFVKAMKRIDEIIPPTNNFNKLFLDLLTKIFVYDPEKRITAREALKHPWFDEIVEDDGTEATKIKLERERIERERNGDFRRETGDRRR